MRNAVGRQNCGRCQDSLYFDSMVVIASCPLPALHWGYNLDGYTPAQISFWWGSQWVEPPPRDGVQSMNEKRRFYRRIHEIRVYAGWQGFVDGGVDNTQPADAVIHIYRQAYPYYQNKADLEQVVSNAQIPANPARVPASFFGTIPSNSDNPLDDLRMTGFPSDHERVDEAYFYDTLGLPYTNYLFKDRDGFITLYNQTDCPPPTYSETQVTQYFKGRGEKPTSDPGPQIPMNPVSVQTILEDPVDWQEFETQVWGLLNAVNFGANVTTREKEVRFTYNGKTAILTDRANVIPAGATYLVGTGAAPDHVPAGEGYYDVDMTGLAGKLMAIQCGANERGGSFRGDYTAYVLQPITGTFPYGSPTDTKGYNLATGDWYPFYFCDGVNSWTPSGITGPVGGAAWDVTTYPDTLAMHFMPLNVDYYGGTAYTLDYRAGASNAWPTPNVSSWTFVWTGSSGHSYPNASANKLRLFGGPVSAMSGPPYYVTAKLTPSHVNRIAVFPVRGTFHYYLGDPTGETDIVTTIQDRAPDTPNDVNWPAFPACWAYPTVGMGLSPHNGGEFIATKSMLRIPANPDSVTDDPELFRQLASTSTPIPMRYLGQLNYDDFTFYNFQDLTLPGEYLFDPSDLHPTSTGFAWLQFTGDQGQGQVFSPGAGSPSAGAGGPDNTAGGRQT